MPWGCCYSGVVGPPPKAILGDDLVVRSSNLDLKVPLVSLPEFLEPVCRHYAPKTAFIDAITGASTSFEELWEQTTAMACAFRRRGLTPGAKVCFHCSNHVLFWPAFMGIAMINGVIVMAKASLTHRELLYQLEDSQPMFVVTEEDHVAKVEECRKSVSSIQELFLFSGSGDYSTVDELLEEGRSSKDADAARPARTDPRDTPLLVLYSSGTTGLPKGVVSAHFNFVSQMVQCGPDGDQILQYTDVIAQWMPCTHLSGVFFTLVALCQGATVLLLPGFHIETLLSSVQRYQATFLPLLPTFAVIVTQSPLTERTNVSSVRTLGIGGSVTPDVVIRDLQRIFNLETLFHVYGMTEMSGMVSITPLHHIASDSVGYPMPLTEVKVLDLVTGKPLAADKDGEILVRGPQLMLGYLNKPEATDNAIDPDGWYKTGDVGHYDVHGQLYIVDRVKDLIKCMDQQVAPAELEELLMRHELVRQAAVAGVPHRQYGEAPRAFVVLAEEAQGLSPQDVAQQLSELIAETSAYHKHLHGGVQFMDELPKSESGKYLRRELRDMYLQSFA
ncbi:luciferin 4-monooxygenase-like [Haemaphysalis longicornis]